MLRIDVALDACLPQWDILCNGGVVEEIAHVSNGREIGNCVSLIRVNVSCRFCFIVCPILIFPFENMSDSSIGVIHAFESS